jgi:ureidoglycolate lyase
MRAGGRARVYHPANMALDDIVAVPLTAPAYAPYGAVIMAAPSGEPGKPANQGTARRFDWLAELEDRRPGRARPNVTVFRCAPRELPFSIELLEKHPASTQLFIPMGVGRYLVAVALGGDRPDVATLQVFLAGGLQGITYRPGVWHHPLIALDAEAHFACLVWEDESPEDCVVASLAEHERTRVVVPG